MDIDSAKENIQPLAGGRNISLLELALNSETQHKVQDELQAKRRDFEERISLYEGDDPLDLWFEYIYWIEQAFPRNGKESAFLEALQRCIQTFEHEQKYKQDPRLVKLYIKFIDSQTNQHELYSFLFSQGIGTMVADLYMCWAYYFEVIGNFKRAEEIYQQGLGARAEPLEELKQSHTQFRLMVAERNLYQDEESNRNFMARMNEKRFALTSLRGQSKRKLVGSLRTDAAVKQRTPGVVVLQENVMAAPTTSNTGAVAVYAAVDDNDETLKAPLDDGGAEGASGTAPQIKSVIDTAIKAYENMREPGPWTSAKKSSKKCSLFSKKEIENNPGFEICEDSMEASKIQGDPSSDDDEGGIQLPVGFVARNELQDELKVPLTIYEETEAVADYKKQFCYPKGLNMEYSFEELLAYKYSVNRVIRPNCRVIEEMEGFMEGVHLPENFARSNKPQTELTVEYYPFEGTANQEPMCKVLSVRGCDECYEEILRGQRLKEKDKKGQTTAESLPVAVAPAAGNDDNEMEIEAGEEEQQMPRRQSDQRADSTSPRQPEETGEFGFNETCSTQIFNLFIKPQSISTPNMGKKNKPAMPRSSLSLYKHSQQQQREDNNVLENSMEEINGQKEPPKASHPQTSPDTVHMLGKQLSVIMETTESSASSGGCQTTEITKNSVVGYGTSVIGEVGKMSLTAKPRKSILKKPVPESAKEEVVDEDIAVPVVPAEPFAIYMDDEGEKTITPKASTTIRRDEDSFLIPPAPAVTAKTHSIPIFRDSMDFFGAPPAATTNGEFAVPLPPKPKTFMPLYNDSMEHFLEKAKTVPRIPVPDEKGANGDRDLHVAEGPLMSIYDAPGREDFEVPKVVADFSIFHDSMVKDKTIAAGAIPKDKSLFGTSMAKLTHDASLSPLSSFLMAPQQRQAKHTENDFTFLDSPKRGNQSKLATSVHSSESIMPTIAAIDPMLLESSMTFPSMREMTMDLKKAGHQSIQEKSMLTKMSQLAIPSHEESVTFNTLMKKEVGKISGDGGPTIGNKSLAMASGGGRGNESIFSVRQQPPTLSEKPQFLDESMTFNSLMRKEGEKTKALPSNQGPSEPTVTGTIFIPKPKLANESMTFNSLMKKEAPRLQEDSLFAKPMELPSMNPNHSTFPNLMTELPSSTAHGFSIFAKKDSIVVNDRSLRKLEQSMSPIPLIQEDDKSKGRVSILGLSMMGKPEATIPSMNNISKPKALNESLTFNSLMKKELPRQSVADRLAQQAMTGNPNQSTCHNLMTELPSSPAHGLPVFVKSNSFEVKENSGIQMEKSISPIPLMVAEEKSDADIYRFENTLRILPEADLPDPESWYNHQLDVTVNFRVDPNAKDQGRTKRNHVDPFDPDLINTFLDKVDFVNYLHSLSTCDMRETIHPLKQGSSLEIVDQEFSVRKLIGKGAFGHIYSAKTADNRLFALKQSKPCNLWEYYICIELKCRLHEFNQDLLPAFIDIDYGLVAKNASIFVLPFCKYGNLLNICNEYKAHMNKNLNEKVVMVLVTQILTIIDALHACQIIHADIKPDNFMLMGPISEGNYDQPAVKLIDFGQAIDMKLFPENVEFTSSLATDGFTCSEMLEGLPWTYQTDLYCVAGTIHTLLFGKYMSVQKGVAGYSIAEKLPRYLQKPIWDEIFSRLLNVDSCRSMPNLQQLKLLLKEYISDNETVAHDEIRRFNVIVQQVETLDK